MTPPSHADTSSPVVSGDPDLPQASAPAKKAAAKRAPAKKAALKAVTSVEGKAPAKRAAAARNAEPEEPIDDLVPAELEDISVE